MMSNQLSSNPLVHRKPVSATASSLPFGDSNQPLQPLYDDRHARSVYGKSLTVLGGRPQPVPPLPVQTPPIPPKTDAQSRPGLHARKPSPPKMLKKVQKSLAVPGEQPPPIPPKVAPVIHAVPSVIPGASSPRLRKTIEHARSSSFENIPPGHQENVLQARQPSPSPDVRGRSSSAQPPTSRSGQLDSPRVASTPGELSTHSRNSSNGSSPPRSSEGKKLRRAWLPGGSSRSNSQDLGKGKSTAWIISSDNKEEYNTVPLTTGDKVPELWNENGDIYVFLCAQGGRLGPSFKLYSQIISTSRVFIGMIQADLTSPGSRGRERERNFDGKTNLSVQDARRQLSPQVSQLTGADGQGEANLYLPLIQASGVPDLERLIAVRNLFAFLTSQPLVGTEDHPTAFTAFLQVAALLREFGFSDYDGSSFGEPVDLSFSLCMDQLGLADLRHSREKTVEALILGEQMRSWALYSEGFAHAVGKYEAIVEMRTPLFKNVSTSTRNRLERAHLDLVRRQENVNLRLEAFDFPSLFAGIASSTATHEYKNVRFKEWSRSFGKMRNFVLGYYKHLFGNWPPKARSKKNHFSESGLNRQCLKILYSDLCALYDLLVDRDSLTPRVIDQAPEEIHDSSVDPRISALRKMLTEFDQSSPPVLPPIPYDVPKLPSMTAIREDYNELPAKQQAKFDKSIQSHELMLILLKSHNIDTDQLQVPFLSAFKDFEHKEAKGCIPQDMADQRVGYWLFLYVVIQCLPMLVVDAPGLRFTEGVEYFLCEPPQGNLPWMEDAGEVRKAWYEVSGGQNIVELSADVVMFSVEATYYRSHCWQAAERWESAQSSGSPRSAGLPAQQPSLPPAPPPHLGGVPPLEPPRAVFQDLDPVSSPTNFSTGGYTGAGTPPHQPASPNLLPLRVSGRNASPAGKGRTPAPGVPGHAYHSSIAMGLEPLNLPQLAPPDRIPGDERFGGGRPGSRAGSGSGPGSRPGSAAGLGPRHRGVVKSVSVGNLSQLAKGESPNGGGDDGRSPHSNTLGSARTGSGSGSTFDDILKGMEPEKKKKRFGF